MARNISESEFLADSGTSDWRIEGGTAIASFATGSFARGVTFVTAIGRIADGANHHPDVLLTYPRVEVRLTTHDAGNVLTELDLSVAKAISDTARELRIEAE